MSWGIYEVVKPIHYSITLMLIHRFNPLYPMAESDEQMQGEHTGHANMPDKGTDFRGIYYGYFPCKEEDCGIKITLSLKRNNNYLLVTQPAKPSVREFFEKGKFTWNDDTRNVVLKPKDKPTTGQYRIVDEGTLIQLNPDG
jgi:copper homeostasis protein (lipoprotein)